MIVVTAIYLRGCSISRRRKSTPSRQGSSRRGASAATLNTPLKDLAIERISHDGRGITQWQDKTLFVEGALPGEVVDARVFSSQSRLAEARVETVQVAAPERTSPPCPHYDLCGGCQLQHIQPEHQLAIKQRAVTEQMARWAKLTPERLLAPIESPSEGYRSRARLGVWYEKNGSVTLGFRRRRSRELTPVDRCLVLAPVLRQLLVPLGEGLAAIASRRAITHVELLLGEEGPAALLRQVKPLTEHNLSVLRALAAEQGVQLWLDCGDGALRDLSGQTCDPRLSYDLPEFGLNLAFHPNDFTQVNRGVNRQMVTRAVDLLQLKPQDQVMDLFCGIGNFTLALASRCERVVGVEAVETMVARGRENAARQSVDNVQFVAGDLARLSGAELQRRCGKVSALLLDPPREGAREILTGIGQLAPERVVYVSCNPATLARDAGLLAECGYRLQSLGVLDMFPHTAHVESMALFERT
ncbi:23S rRNA (uracil(1939)-C(5))-methyltransferase RlmD [Marinimicrobium sp. ABcell2]|uniref:23S rRNA (uracil(1939)-C(5))-methyltransferase RlmD n=1 Tax=Marinimicrobium sp. ABcell2 TaxID=3069751 RepID=UPI0027AECA7F|nr:23S rRNA (uracil(1939)-C(5))-methyltransferase RlmD [Marinimicrobium sp. ABcell2]MDQ2075392.1 23S rRNA (uracil(1939)-C(5))-methyltransferase RlmD [Marinimicrobium sp. ABcell2]